MKRLNRYYMSISTNVLDDYEDWYEVFNDYTIEGCSVQCASLNYHAFGMHDRNICLCGDYSLNIGEKECEPTGESDCV